jgi:hypothetical protein
MRAKKNAPPKNNGVKVSGQPVVMDKRKVLSK